MRPGSPAARALLGLLLLAVLGGPALALPWYQHYEEGLDLEGRGQWAEALEAFRAAEGLEAGPRERIRTYGSHFLFAYDPVFHQARCLAELGRIEEAEEHLERARRAAVTPAGELTAVAERLAALKAARSEPQAPPPRPGTLVVHSNPPALVRLDGRPMGATPLAGVETAAGRHRVELEAPGHRPWTQSVEIRSGERLVLEVELRPAPAAGAGEPAAAGDGEGAGESREIREPQAADEGAGTSTVGEGGAGPAPTVAGGAIAPGTQEPVADGGPGTEAEAAAGRVREGAPPESAGEPGGETAGAGTGEAGGEAAGAGTGEAGGEAAGARPGEPSRQAADPTQPADPPAPVAEGAGQAFPPALPWLAGIGLAAALAVALLIHRRRRAAALAASVHHLPRRLGGYRLLEELGRGGMATTYRARRLADGRAVALKLPHRSGDPTFQARFIREGKLGETLHHPGIVRILEAGEDRGQAFLAMELLPGRTLRAEVDARPQGLPVERALEIARAIAEALDYAHSKGVVHRDLKPENIMLLPGGGLKVMDFGVARIEGQHGLTTSQAFFGSPLYAAPEAVDPPTIGPRSDLYSLGIVLFELLQGRPPFVHESLFKLLELHQRQPMPRAGDLPRPLPPEVWRIVARLCAKRPEDRHGSAQELLVDLARVLNERSGAREPGCEERRAAEAGGP